MKQLRKVTSAGVVQPAAFPTSTLLPKLHPILLWCSETTYDDGAPRTPGTFRLATRGTVWSMTLTDPDSCTRLTVVGIQIDDVLKLLVAHLSAENAPWEHDPYAQGTRVSQPKKKGA